MLADNMQQLIDNVNPIGCKHVLFILQKINQYEQDLDSTTVAIGNQYADAQEKE